MIASSRLARPSLLISSRPRSRGSSRITALSPCCVGMVATRMSISERPTRSRAAPSCGSRRSAMLRPARILMREISACGGTPERRRHRAQQPVDAHAHDEPGAERLDVDVAGAQFDRALEQIVERAHHRRAAGEIAQALDVVVGLLGRSPSASVLGMALVAVEPLRARW